MVGATVAKLSAITTIGITADNTSGSGQKTKKKVTPSTAAASVKTPPALLWCRIASWLNVLPHSEMVMLKQQMAQHVDTAVCEEAEESKNAALQLLASQQQQTDEGSSGSPASVGSSGGGGNSGSGSKTAATFTPGRPSVVAFQYTSGVSGARLSGHIVWLRVGPLVILSTLVLSPTPSAVDLLRAEQETLRLSESVFANCNSPSSGISPEMLTTSVSRLSAIGSEAHRITNPLIGAAISDAKEEKS